MDLQVSKFVFENSLHLGETFFFCWCDIFSFFEFILLGNSSMAPAFSFNQINKLPENLYFTVGTVSAISPSLQWPRCFNNTILYHNEAIKNAVVIQNNSLSFRPSFSDEGTFSVSTRANQGNIWLTSTKTQVLTERKNPSRARVSGYHCKPVSLN